MGWCVFLHRKPASGAEGEEAKPGSRNGNRSGQSGIVRWRSPRTKNKQQQNCSLIRRWTVAIVCCVTVWWCVREDQNVSVKVEQKYVPNKCMKNVECLFVWLFWWLYCGKTRHREREREREKEKVGMTPSREPQGRFEPSDTAAGTHPLYKENTLHRFSCWGAPEIWPAKRVMQFRSFSQRNLWHVLHLLD